MRAPRAVVALLLAALGAAAAARPPGGKVASGSAATAPGEQARRERLEADLRALADDAFEGRRTGEPGAEKAAAFLARAFEGAGLAPDGTDGFLQPFETTTRVRLGPGCRLRLQAGRTTLEAAPGYDFIPLAFSEGGQFSGPLVFAGYGVTSSEPPYDDFASLEVEGAAVLVLRHEPQEQSDASPFAGRGLTSHADLRHKALNAHEHGAAALLLVNDALGHTPEEDRLLPLADDPAVGGGHLLAVHVRRGWVERLPRSVLPRLRRWQKRVDRSLAPDSRALEGVRVDLSVEIQRERRTVTNVLGLLHGTDPRLRDEVVLVGAHYDHLGRGDAHALDPEAQGQIHKGADDNASGVSALLEMARLLAARRQDLRRSVLFVAFTGEEQGLLGSSHYVSHPAVPLARTVAMINLDTIGRPRAGHLHVGGVGTSPAFEPLLRALDDPYGLTLELSRAGSGPSDHVPFYTRRVPVLSFFAGAHADYHRASDDPERIDFEALARVCGLATDVVWSLAGAFAAPVFAEVEEERPQAGEGYGAPESAYLGELPDYAESDWPGVTLAGVRSGSPAERAGLRAGDRVLRLGGLSIDNLYDLSHALQVHRPGERVRLRYERGEQEIEADVVLEARPQSVPPR